MSRLLLQRARRWGRAEGGFSLLELVMVVAIIAALAAIAVPRMTQAIDNAKTNADRADVQQIAAALERFYEANGKYPLRLTELRDEGLLKANFTFKNKFDKWYLYAVNDLENPAAFVLADPGRTPKSSAVLEKNEASPTPRVVPEGRSPSDTPYFWQASGNKAGEQLRLTENTVYVTDIPKTLSGWGRKDLMTE